MSRFTRIPQSTFEELQVNAGVLAYDFDPVTGVLNEEDIFTSTSGGITITANAEYEDFGADIDNCPKDTKELKRKTSMSAGISTTALNISKETLAFYLGASDIREDGAVVTRKDLEQADFRTVWWVGDLANGSFLAIKLLDVLSTGGVSLKTTDKGKGNLSVTLTAHNSLQAQNREPIEFYVGEPADTASIRLNLNNVTVVEGATQELIATTVPENATVTWDTSDESVATVTDGVITAVDAGVCVIIATITVEGQSYIDSCNVVVTEAEEGEG